jgi:hypothetical protein
VNRDLKGAAGRPPRMLKGEVDREWARKHYPRWEP